MHGFEHRRKFPLWIEICRGRDADRPDDRGSEIGEDVSEKIGADDHVEPIRMAHEMGGQGVDVVLIGASANRTVARVTAPQFGI